MRNPFRSRVEYVVERVAADGVILRGLGSNFPSLHNNTDQPIRLTFTVAGSGGEQRQQDICPRETATFHTNDGKFRADFIEIIGQ